MEILKFNVDQDRRNLVSNKQEFKVDFKKSPSWIQARQYEDQMRQVQVRVVHGDNSPFDLTDVTPMLEGWMPDGTHRIIDNKHGVLLDPQNGVFRFDFPAPVFAVAGSYKQIFFRLWRHGQNIATLEFSMEVLADKVIDGLIPRDYVTPLEEIYDKMINIYKNADNKFKAQIITWQQQFNDIVTKLNGNYDTVLMTANHLSTSLSALEDKIKADNLITQTDFKPIANEIAQARGDKSDLKTRLADLPDKKDLTMTTNFADVDGGIPSYNVQPLASLKQALNPKQFNLGLGTDYHYATAFDQLPFAKPDRLSDADVANLYRSGLRKTLNLLFLSDQLDAVVFNGDNADQPRLTPADGERQAMLKEQSDFAQTVFSVAQCPAFILKGNHDNNYYLNPEDLTPSNVLHDHDFKQLYQQNGNFGEQRQNGSNYYYKDFTNKKVRLIGLDTSDLPETASDGQLDYDRFKCSGLQQNQLNWLANKALQVPTDYTVIVTMHWPVNHTVFAYDDTKMINHGLLKQILEDFVTGCVKKTGTSTEVLPVNINYEFKHPGKLAAVISGHRHLDQATTIKGVNYVITRCSLIAGDNELGVKRLDYAGTPAEDAFDLISLDTNAQTITFKRFGAGSDDPKYAKRVFKY